MLPSDTSRRSLIGLRPSRGEPTTWSVEVTPNNKGAGLAPPFSFKDQRGAWPADATEEVRAVSNLSRTGDSTGHGPTGPEPLGQECRQPLTPTPQRRHALRTALAVTSAVLSAIRL